MMNDLITALEIDKKGMHLVINEDTPLWIPRVYLRECDYEIGQAVDRSELEAWLLPRQYRLALDVAVRDLGVRARSEGEIRQKLQKQGYLDETTEMVCFRLRQLKFLDDEQFATAWVASRIRKRLGTHRIVMELRQKGISRDVIDRVMSELSEDAGQEEACQMAQKLLQRYRNDPPQKQVQKTIAGLARRGYGFSQAKEAIDEALQRMQEDISGEEEE